MKYCRAGQATADNIIRRMRFACWLTQARIHTHTHTLVIFNIYCFSTARMITRTLLNVTIHIQRLSCYYVKIKTAGQEAPHVLWAVSQLSQATNPPHLQWLLQHSKHCHWTVDFTFRTMTALRLKCCQNFTTKQQNRWRTTPHTATPGKELTKGCHPPHHVGSRYVTQQVPDMNDVTNSVGMLTAQLRHRTQPEQTHNPLDKERKMDGKTWRYFSDNAPLYTKEPYFEDSQALPASPC